MGLRMRSRWFGRLVRMFNSRHYEREVEVRMHSGLVYRGTLHSLLKITRRFVLDNVYTMNKANMEIDLALDPNSWQKVEGTAELNGRMEFSEKEVFEVIVLSDEKLMGDFKWETMRKIYKKFVRDEFPSHMDLVEWSRSHVTSAFISNPDIDQIDSYCIIDDINGQDFVDAVKTLRRQKEIGIAFHGNFLTTGHIHWMTMACCTNSSQLKCEAEMKDTYYIFHMNKLGKNVLNNELGGILDNENILKIMHDCRLVSDSLFHEYGIKLANVFDTQVGGMMVFKQDHGGLAPQYVDSLLKCLEEHLHYKPQSLPQLWRRFYALEEDESSVDDELRPEMKRIFVEEVKYLSKLKDKLTTKMLSDFVIGIECKLANVRDATDEDLVQKCLEHPNRTPKEWFEVDERKSQIWRDTKKLLIHPITGRCEIVQHIRNAPVRFGRNSWKFHKATEYGKKQKDAETNSKEAIHKDDSMSHLEHLFDFDLDVDEELLQTELCMGEQCDTTNDIFAPFDFLE